MFKSGVSSRIWRGDKKVIREAEAAFLADPDAELISFACVLYSFRQKKYCRERLASLRLPLMKRLLGWTFERGGNEADCLTTYVLWIAENVPLIDSQRDEMFGAVYEVCDQVLRACDVPRCESHTKALIGLTLARLGFAMGDQDRTSYGSHYAFQYHEDIDDPKQKARVMRGIGTIQKRKGNRKIARIWFKQALLVPDVPFAVRFKTLAAWSGFAR